MERLIRHEGRTVFKYRLWIYPLIVAFFTAVFGFSMNMPWYLALAFSVASSCALYLIDLLVATDHVRPRRVTELMERATDPAEIIHFLGETRPSQRWEILALASVASVATTATIVWAMVFFSAPNDQPTEPYAAVIISTIGLGVLATGAVYFGVKENAKQCDSTVVELLRASTSPVSRQVIEDYDRRRSLEHADRFYFPCPSCGQRIVPPEELSGLAGLDCLGCGLRLDVVATNEATPPAPPLLLTHDWLIVCAGINGRAFALNQLPFPLLGGRPTSLGGGLFISFNDGPNSCCCGNLPRATFDKVLDAFERYHPYPGPPTCWYCGKNVGNPTNQATFPINKVTGSSTTGSFTTTYFQQMTVNVPRCAECSAAHNYIIPESLVSKLLAAMAMLVLVAGAIALCFLLPWNNPESKIPRAFWGPFALWVVVVVGFLGGAIFCSKKKFFRTIENERQQQLRAMGIKPYDSIDLFPPYRALWQQGFRPGAKPGFDIHFNNSEAER